MSSFNRIYPFTTEDIAGYFPFLKLEGKDILTVGSSIDQALNALLLGAKNIVLYDINPNTHEFYQRKRDIILHTNQREEAYSKVISIKDIPFTEELFSYQDLTKMNLYFQSEETYKALQEKLKEDKIEWVEGDIFHFSKSLQDRKFDRIIFSNILQYLDLFAKEYGYEEKEREFLRENFEIWKDYLSDEGILQLVYYYCLKVNLEEFLELGATLETYPISLHSFGENKKYQDAIVTYKKERR